MPVTQSQLTSTECNLTEWSIDPAKRDKLVKILAYLYLRQEQNAERIIETLETRTRSSTERVLPNAIAKLTAPRPADIEVSQHGDEVERKKAADRIKVSIWHRDGHLFQYLSWVVARLANPNDILTPPHVRQADKGFDGFIIEFDDAQKQVQKVVLCEDKASQDPRRLVTKKGGVWDEITSICAGEREDEASSALTTLLKAVPGLSDEELEDAVDAIFWEKTRQFRVSIATGEDQRGTTDFAHLVAGFDNVALGALSSRIGGVLPFDDVRNGLHQLAQDVIAKLQSIGSTTEGGDV